MKIKNNHLDIFKNTTNISNELKVYGKELSMSLLNTDVLYVGFKKPLNQLYIELKTPNTNASTVTVQQWNGSAWENIGIVDETNGLKNSGFLFLDEDANNVNQNLVNGITQKWYKITVNVSTSAMVMNGINLVFNNLDDLRMEEPAIDRFFPREIQSHIFSMVASRDYIIRRINNSQPMNYYSAPIDALKGNSYIDVRLLNQFDIFDVNELRDCSTYYCLYKIFFNRQDGTDDVYKEKAQEYLDLFESTFKLFTGRKLTIDLGNDGKEDSTDKVNSIRTIKLIR